MAEVNTNFPYCKVVAFTKRKSVKYHSRSILAQRILRLCLLTYNLATYGDHWTSLVVCAKHDINNDRDNSLQRSLILHHLEEDSPKR